MKILKYWFVDTNKIENPYPFPWLLTSPLPFSSFNSWYLFLVLSL